MSSLKQSSILHLPAHLSVCKVTAAESSYGATGRWVKKKAVHA